MKLQLFRSLWTTGQNLTAALADCEAGWFDGVEGQVPREAAARREFAMRLRGVPYLAEITSATDIRSPRGYVPEAQATVERHVETLREALLLSMEAAPLRITTMSGSDAWGLAECVEYFGAAMEAAREAELGISFETHRARALFHPWITREILRQLPGMELTCDFSHWCCVTERLVMDEEPEILALCAARAAHLHGRVGYDQGAQVPHPAAPEYAEPLAAHERWWRTIWQAQAARGIETVTMTPEFGPDGYLHTLPFTNQPVASLDEINRWMAWRLREKFAAFTA